MPDQRFLYTEEVVGANHPTKTDTINRLALAEHNNDGTHKSGITLDRPVFTSHPSFSVHKNGTNQAGVVNNTDTKVTWSTEEYDTNANFASDKFTPAVEGKYLLTAAVQWVSMSARLPST